MVPFKPAHINVCFLCCISQIVGELYTFAGVCSSVSGKTILISEIPIPPTLRIHNIYSVVVEISLLIWKSWLAGGAMEKLKRKF